MTLLTWALLGAALIAAALVGYLLGRAGRPVTKVTAVTTLPQPVVMSAMLRPLIEAMPEPSLLLDAGGRVVVFNRPAQDLTGAIEGKPLATTFRVPGVLQALSRVLDEGPPEDIDFVLPVPVERTIEAHLAPLELGAGQPKAFIQLRDTTAMTRVERMRADFVANASHELRTPLTSLSGFLETIRGPAKDDPEATERFLEIMQTQADRMRRLIDDLLSLSRIELNEHVRPLGRSDLAGITRDVIDAAQPTLTRENIKAILTVEEGVPSVAGDRDELLQVVQNLLDNAVKYGFEGGDIQVEVSRKGEMVACAITDRGPGIAREHIPRLTERFYRVDAKASRERGGTGLGLAIVKHILNRHRGRLEVDSEIGRGSTFTIMLPVAVRS